jgi:hypothetical protein
VFAHESFSRQVQNRVRKGADTDIERPWRCEGGGHTAATADLATTNRRFTGDGAGWRACPSPAGPSSRVPAPRR